MSCGGCIGAGEKVVNFAKAMALAAKTFAIGDPVFVTPEAWKARLSICAKCEHFQGATATAMPTCARCGCVVKAKAWLATEDCPADKWKLQV